MSIGIRPLTAADVEIATTLFATIATDGDARHFHPHAMTAEAARAICEKPGLDVFVVACEGDRPVGYGMLRGWNEGYAIPSLGIYVAADQRGRGLAMQLMQSLHRIASERGAPKVRLRVAPDNARAVALYRRLGYQFAEQDRGQLVGLLDLSVAEPGRSQPLPHQGTER